MECTEIVIKALDLKGHRDSLDWVSAPMPQSEQKQRSQLEAVVHARYPRARFRTFGSEAATFVSREHLIVAHYADGQAVRAAARAEEPDGGRQTLAA